MKKIRALCACLALIGGCEATSPVTPVRGGVQVNITVQVPGN